MFTRDKDKRWTWEITDLKKNNLARNDVKIILKKHANINNKFNFLLKIK